MAEIKLEEVQEKQKVMTELALQLTPEMEADKIIEISDRLVVMGKELQELALAFEAQVLATATPANKMRGGTEVVLTEPQRERILKETGIKMETIVLADETGVIAKAMPDTDPKVIELKALKAARAQAATHYAEQTARVKMYESFAEIEAASPEAAELLAKLKEDPNFMSGMLQKLEKK